MFRETRMFFEKEQAYLEYWKVDYVSLKFLRSREFSIFMLSSVVLFMYFHWDYGMQIAYYTRRMNRSIIYVLSETVLDSA